VAAGATAAARPPEARIVGTASRRAERAAKNRADRVDTVLDFKHLGKAIVGRFSGEAAENLSKGADIRYVEHGGTMEKFAETLPWGVDRVDAEVGHSDGGTGGGVGVATGADLLAGKVLMGCGSGTCSAIASGVNWATDQGADVSNLSLGGSAGSSTLQDACQYAYDNNVVTIAAAGNDGACTGCVGYPAARTTGTIRRVSSRPSHPRATRRTATASRPRGRTRSRSRVAMRRTTWC
jgi:subtilisin